MADIKEKVKEQLDQANQSIEQIAKAGRGLVIKLSDGTNKQFNDLIKVGQQQEEEGKTIVSQVRSTWEGQLSGKEYVGKVKLAALGLVTKTKDGAQRLFDELVQLGENQKSEPVAAAAVKKPVVAAKPAAAPKKSEVAA
jgi:polyhydroxyalkanoate synthesis regulator phasin